MQEEGLQKGAGGSGYLVEQINHHSSSGFPYRGDNLRAATLPRKIHHVPHEPLGAHPIHHEDDGYVDALRRNAYNNQGVGKLCRTNVNFCWFFFFLTLLLLLQVEEEY